MSNIQDFKCERCGATVRGHDSIFIIGARCPSCKHMNKQYIIQELLLVKNNKEKYNQLVKQARELMTKKFKEK